jgi:hypothetical protein
MADKKGNPIASAMWIMPFISGSPPNDVPKIHLSLFESRLIGTGLAMKESIIPSFR